MVYLVCTYSFWLLFDLTSAYIRSKEFEGREREQREISIITKGWERISPKQRGSRDDIIRYHSLDVPVTLPQERNFVSQSKETKRNQQEKWISATFTKMREQTKTRKESFLLRKFEELWRVHTRKMRRKTQIEKTNEHIFSYDPLEWI